MSKTAFEMGRIMTALQFDYNGLVCRFLWQLLATTWTIAWHISANMVSCQERQFCLAAIMKRV